MPLQEQKPVMPMQQLDHSAPQSTWRDDVADVALVSGVLGAGTLFVGLLLVAAGYITSLQDAGRFLIGLFLVVWLPFAVLGGMRMNGVIERQRLGWTRSKTERWVLATMALDIDDSGDTSEAELVAFLKYARHLYHNASTSSTEAEKALRIPFAVWSRYRNILVAMGWAKAVGKGPGTGFEMHDRFYKMPWPKIERQMRDVLLTRFRLDVTEPPPSSFPQNPKVLAVPPITPDSGGVGVGVDKQARKTLPKKASAPVLEPKSNYAREPVSSLPPDVAIGDPDE